MPSEYATGTSELTCVLVCAGFGGDVGDCGGRRIWGVRGARTDIPSLCDEYTQREEQEENGSAYPSVCHKWCRLVEVGLEYLLRVNLRPHTSPP